MEDKEITHAKICVMKTNEEYEGIFISSDGITIEIELWNEFDQRTERVCIPVIECIIIFYNEDE